MTSSPPSPSLAIVAGGTGNVGSFVVAELLARGSTVVVPSRSEEKIAELKDFLVPRLTPEAIDRLCPVLGDFSDEIEAERMRREITEDIGTPDAVLAALGRFHQVSDILEARPEDFRPVLDGYLFAHLAAARTFLPLLHERGGVYASVNGPLAFDIWPGSNSELVSIVTAAQHMLFRAMARRHDERPVQVVELVTHAFIRNRETQPGSPLPGEAVGTHAAHFLSGAEQVHGESIHLRSPDRIGATEHAQ